MTLGPRDNFYHKVNHATHHHDIIVDKTTWLMSRVLSSCVVNLIKSVHSIDLPHFLRRENIFMRWSYLFVAKVVVSCVFLVMSMMYAFIGMSSASTSRNSYFGLLKFLVLLFSLTLSIYFLGFFEAGQVGACRLAVMTEIQILTRITSESNNESKDQIYFKSTQDIISRPRGLETYLVSKSICYRN